MLTRFGLASSNGPCDLKGKNCPLNRRGQGHVEPNWVPLASRSAGQPVPVGGVLSITGNEWIYHTDGA